MDFYNNKRQHGSLGRVSPIKIWNEYYHSLSSDRPQIRASIRGNVRVKDRADTGLALDSSGDTANFANR